MNFLVNLGFHEAQCRCAGSSQEIHPYRETGLRGYGLSVDRRAPDDAYTVLGRIVFKGRDVKPLRPFFLLLACHLTSVIGKRLAPESRTSKRILSLKLSERLSDVRIRERRCSFSSFGRVLLFLFHSKQCLSPAGERVLWSQCFVP